MRFVIFCHSLRSCWNHGNAHFLRGIVSELVSRGHEVAAYEPADAWSVENLRAEAGPSGPEQWLEAYPSLRGVATPYDARGLDLDEALDGVDVVLVHEWNDRELVRRVGAHRARSPSYRLFFHDTHHRAVTQPEAMGEYDLRHYDGVLAFGRVIRDLYLERGWAARAWTWHEAADVRVFRPPPAVVRVGDVAWIGNWGDDERSAELREYLLEPIALLGLRAVVHGVRYPAEAIVALAGAGIEYRGWLPNHRAPVVFGRHRTTVHVPRRPYARALPGIPTIRVFEALACGIPLVSAPWEDTESLFTPGEDFLVARNASEMRACLRAVLRDEGMAHDLAARGLRTILERHTCAHRVDELLAIVRETTTRPAATRSP